MSVIVCRIDGQVCDSISRLVSHLERNHDMSFADYKASYEDEDALLAGLDVKEVEKIAEEGEEVFNPDPANMSKTQLDEYAKVEFGIDLDRRKTKSQMLKQLEKELAKKQEPEEQPEDESEDVVIGGIEGEVDEEVVEDEILEEPMIEE